MLIVVLDRSFGTFSTQGACFWRAAWTPRGNGALNFVDPHPRRSQRAIPTPRARVFGAPRGRRVETVP